MIYHAVHTVALRIGIALAPLVTTPLDTYDGPSVTGDD